MSKFLGPIHFWLHGKIKLHDQMELAFEERFFENLHSDSNYRAFDEEFGVPSPDEDLESHIQTDNIHGWLQERIRKVETRFAAKLTYLKAQYGENVLITAQGIYSEFGAKSAENAKLSEGFKGQTELAYKFVNNYVLEGMPCDQAGSVTVQTPNSLEWHSARCLHKNYWESVDGDVSVHYRLRDAFNQAFFATLADFSYIRTENEGMMAYKIYR